MKRLVAAGTAILALAIPTMAGAGLSASAAPAKGGAMSVKFTVLKQGGKPVGVDEFRVKRLPMTCTEGPATLGFNLSLPGGSYFPVNNRDKFRAVGQDTESKVKITGKFVTNNKVKGRVKAEGDYPNADPTPLTGCTGSKGFSAG